MGMENEYNRRSNIINFDQCFEFFHRMYVMYITFFRPKTGFQRNCYINANLPVFHYLLEEFIIIIGMKKFYYILQNLVPTSNARFYIILKVTVKTNFYLSGTVRTYPNQLRALAGALHNANLQNRSRSNGT